MPFPIVISNGLVTGNPILDFGFWILDWRMPHQSAISKIEIMQV
jgi:hypothetical protein